MASQRKPSCPKAVNHFQSAPHKDCWVLSYWFVAAESVRKACNCLLPNEKPPGNTFPSKSVPLSGRGSSGTVWDVSLNPNML